MDYINSYDNKKLNIWKLNIKKYRSEYSQYIIEGEKIIIEAMNNDIEIKEFFISESYINNDLLKKISRIYDCHIIKDDIFYKVSDTKTPQGIMAIVNNLNSSKNSKDSDMFLILEAIQDPGNMGTIIRAECFLVEKYLYQKVRLIYFLQKY